MQSNLDYNTKVKVIGVGEAGIQALEQIAIAQVPDVELLALDTDIRSIERSSAHQGLCIGDPNLGSHGMDSGANPELGYEAIMASSENVRWLIGEPGLVVIIAGMGGGTGTGAAPIVAELSRQQGALTAGMVIKPYNFEGKRRMATAHAGIKALGEQVDVLLYIENRHIYRLLHKDAMLEDLFPKADELLAKSARCLHRSVYCPGGNQRPIKRF